MKIQIKIKEFKKAIDLIDSANYKIADDENANINVPSIFLKADEESAFLIALNKEIYIKMPISVQVITPGEISMDNSVLKKILKTMEGEAEISCDTETNKITITSDGDSVEINNLSLVKFKKLPEFNDKKKLCDIIAGTLSNSIKAVSSAVPTKEPQVSLNSCCLEFNSSIISFVGFDGYKLIKHNLKVDNLSPEFTEKILIPAEASNAIAKSLAKGKASVSMSLCEIKDRKYLVIEKDEIIIATRLRDFNYPKYESLIRSDNTFAFVIDQSKLKETISSIAGIGSAKEALPVHFIFDKDKVSLRFVTQDSTVSKTLSIESSNGTPYRFKLMGKHLKDVLPFLENRIQIQVFEKGLVIISPEANTDYIFVTRILE